MSLKRYRYTAMERDDETGLSYHGARYYALWLGRWVSCDPSGLSGGLNLYAYGANSPVVFLDVTGNEPLVVPVNEEYQNKFYKGHRIGGTQVVPRHVPAKRGKPSDGGGRGGKARASKSSNAAGKEGGVEGGTGTADSTATKLSNSKYTEVGAGDGLGGLGEKSDKGIGPDGAGGNSGSSPTGTGTITTTGVKGGSVSGSATGKGTKKEKGSARSGSEGDGGNNPGNSSALDFLAAAASLILDPESLYNAQHSGHKGKGGSDRKREPASFLARGPSFSSSPSRFGR